MGYRYSNEINSKLRILNLRKKRPNSAIDITTRWKNVDRIGKHWMKRYVNDIENEYQKPVDFF